MSETTKEMIEIFDQENDLPKAPQIDSELDKIPVYLTYGPRGEKLLIGTARYEATDTTIVLRMDFVSDNASINSAMYTIRSLSVGK